MTDLLAWLVLCLIAVLAIGGAAYYDLRAWWRTRRNRNVLSCLTPRCVECARKIDGLVEPFHAGAVQLVRCAGCGVHLQARRDGARWEICTVTEGKRQRTAPLPAVLPLRQRIGGGLARVFFNPREGVQPGESALEDEHA